MNNLLKTFALPVILGSTFIVSSFFSALPEIILYLNGGLLGSTAKLISVNASQNFSFFNCSINLTLSILFLALYIKSKSFLAQTILALLSLVFLFCFILFLNPDSENASSNFDDQLINSVFFSSGLLCVAAFTKYILYRS